MYKIKNFKPRNYQKEIVTTTSKNNTLVVLPTGTGKTKLAILTAIERLKQHPNSNILVMTPTKPLSAQIHREFIDSTNIPKEQIVLLTGALKPKLRQELWEQAIVIIATPQTIQKDVEAERISLSPTSLLTVDECVTKDTKIRLALNKEITIKDLSKENIKKKKIYVESLNKKTGELEPTKLLKVHKIKSNKKTIKITSKNNNEIKITGDHIILIKRNNKTMWIKAKHLKLNDKIASSKFKKEKLSNKIILNEKNIIKTFKEKQQELTYYYKKAIKLKEKNKIGSIKIARMLKTKESIIRNYVYKPHRKPIPIHLIEKLKEENFLPLKYSNPKLKIIARLMGHLYGDGWHYITKEQKKVLGFSGKIEDLERIKKDLNLLNIKHQNIHSRITKSKINHVERGQREVEGTSNSFHVTDSKLTRIIEALSVPSGNKTNKEIQIPKWLMKSAKSIKKEFLSALMGSEGYKPINKKGTRQFYAIRLSFYKKKELKQDGIKYANQIKKLFKEFKVDCNISIKKGNIRKDNTESIKFLITISNSNENMIRFLKNTSYN